VSNFPETKLFSHGFCPCFDCTTFYLNSLTATLTDKVMVVTITA
jgi:hypothetical protein